ncbi:hypothetical protein LOTGIDRAFT_142356 [Lottia gigantea]|uniref:FAD dependent oxidoreductase domain-containing protein n=1 Tax=Lottia gigantea TaxID=225164 RepID=V4AZ52_LOTGI|nr:hypothetical protein LOTGIDRAFT_142356 [Lottia gigantea]ESO99006.1 hypothetical protein LOTGIDRAFT_142356 [Lottia gigantea]
MESRRTWCDTNKTHFDYIVAGCGGIGSATVYWLAKKAHAGERRDYLSKKKNCRMAYHDEKYTKLTRPAYQAWGAIEKESGLQVLYKCGGLDISKPSEVDLQCYEDAMNSHNIRYEKLNAEQLEKKFPQFKVDKDVVSLYQPEAGLVDAALANSVHQQLARGYGASFLTNCSVVRVHRKNNGRLLIKTTKGDFTCRKLLVTCGAWSNNVLGSIGIQIPLIVTQEQVTYFGTPHMKEFTKNRFPVFSYLKPDFSLYQIPVHGRSGPKVGIDSLGKRVTPHTRDFKPSPEVEQFTTDFMENILPKVKFIGPVLETKTCLYDMLPDRDFVIDTCDKVGYSDVIVCIGSAHAFKFACLLGKILSEMAIDGRTQYDISGFSMNRPAITDPNFQPFLVFRKTEPKSKL